MPPDVQSQMIEPSADDDKDKFPIHHENCDGALIAETSNHKLNPWPETVEVKGFFAHIMLEFEKWTYSYMSPLLRKGSEQSLKGSHLREEDLFSVPDFMKSENLVAQFK